MQDNKTILITLIGVVVLGFVGYALLSKSPAELPVTDVATTTTPTTEVTYTNNEFGFNFSLPQSWAGYSVLAETWTGTPITATTTKQTGPKLIIRNPKWTKALPYEDIPVLVFTTAQWSAYIAENFSVSAAPILATELGRNDRYVFALPPRWNFDQSEGYAEAENIVKANPLKAFNKQPAASGKLNMDVVCRSALAYTTFADAASAEKFVADCKDGKHPEVIERYKADMNLGDGAAI